MTYGARLSPGEDDRDVFDPANSGSTSGADRRAEPLSGTPQKGEFKSASGTVLSRLVSLSQRIWCGHGPRLAGFPDALKRHLTSGA